LRTALTGVGGDHRDVHACLGQRGGAPGPPPG
jgi:hypothetical protein